MAAAILFVSRSCPDWIKLRTQEHAMQHVSHHTATLGANSSLSSVVLEMGPMI